MYICLFLLNLFATIVKLKLIIFTFFLLTIIISAHYIEEKLTWRWASYNLWENTVCHGFQFIINYLRLIFRKFQFCHGHEC